ncbi:lipopolysaccharide kinase InaA family protein [Cryptosporangium arvum]|uniref:lipopolysaccharide kinase InaA family protein n=1 Tax=Cryptosporangium arvum TaxID=80871 RepID=UPI0004B9AC42|nr:lipopolysaccharide kinase InaA family protein [Cryptosporangium arvum]
MSAFEDAVFAIFAAQSPADLFDTEDTFRRLRRTVHPDVAPLGSEGIATSAFTRLTELWEARQPAVGRYSLENGPIEGDLADLFRSGTALLKIARDPADNDLLAAEAEALRRPKDRRHRAYFPALRETLVVEDDGDYRAVNVLEHCDGFVSLAAVARAYPDGVDPRDAAWMWRRLLVALGAAHRAGLVHGAVLPEHVLIHPGDHGLVLVDWCYSVAPGAAVPALVERYRDAYPPEVPGKRPATPATDLYLASGLMLRLMGGRAPAALRRFANGCRLTAPRMRPDDAWHLLGELDELLQALYGPRRFRTFTVPA